ncbi:MAG: type II secretion system F family protein [Aureliella sp.]
MPRYIYEAFTPAGETLQSEIEAANVSDAVRLLQDRGLSVQSIRAVIQSPDIGTESGERSAFVERLEASLAHREQLIPALEALAAEAATRGARHDLDELIARLKRGATAEEFIRHESASSWLPLLAGGVSDELGRSGFLRFISQAARESESRSRRRRALAYPIAIFTLCMLLIVILLYAVVPIFADMFRDFGLKLSGPTRARVGVSDQMFERPLVSLVVAISAILLAVFLIRTWRRYALTTRFFGLFTSGSTANVVAMARFTGTLNDLLQLEAPLPDALRIAGRATQHYHFKRAAERLAADIARNQAPSSSAVAHNLPQNVLRALSLGADGRPNLPLLAELSQLYSDRVDERFDWSAQLVGPTAILSIGVVVGFVVIALFAPLVNMVSALF